MRLHLTLATFREVVDDLCRSSSVAYERVGVTHCRFSSQYQQNVIVVTKYIPCPEESYVDGPEAANFDARWLMRASEVAASENAGVFLTHMHEHKGIPWFSPPDMNTNKRLVHPISRIDPTLPCGALLLSLNSAVALVAVGTGFTTIRPVMIVGLR